MNRNKRSSEQGFAITALVAIVGLVSLAVTGTKVATHVYQKSETEKIANQFEEQAQHLAKRAEKMGKAGDEAVRESLRLHQAAKDIRKHSTLVYQQKMISEGAGLATSLVASKAVGGTAKEIAQGLGSTLDKVKTISEISGMLVDVKGINEELAKAQKMVAKKEPTIETEEDKKLYELIRGSRTNVDDFHLAQMKAMTDEIISMRKKLEEMGKEIEGWIAVREQALKDLEEAAQKRRQNQRAEARLKVLENDDLASMIEKEFVDQSGPIDVLKEMFDQEETKEAKKEGGEKGIFESKEGKIAKKELSPEAVSQAIKAAQQELKWGYYRFSPPDEFSHHQRWLINKGNKLNYRQALSVFYFQDEVTYSEWRGSYCQAKYYPETKTTITPFEVGGDMLACCVKSDEGGTLRLFPQDRWYIYAASKDKNCGQSFVYLKAFWQNL